MGRRTGNHRVNEGEKECYEKEITWVHTSGLLGEISRSNIDQDLKESVSPLLFSWAPPSVCPARAGLEDDRLVVYCPVQL